MPEREGASPMERLAPHRPKRLYLLRHGHTAEAPPDAAADDPPLSGRGLDQARAMALHLAEQPGGLRGAAVFCTGKARTRATAEPFAELAGAPAAAVPELNEIPFGFPRGEPMAGVVARYLAFRDDLRALPPERVAIAGGLFFAELLERYAAGLRRVLEAPGDRAVLVGHGGLNLILLCRFIGAPYHCLMAFYQHHCCLNVVDCLPGGSFIVQTLNHTPWDPAKGLEPVDPFGPPP